MPWNLEYDTAVPPSPRPIEPAEVPSDKAGLGAPAESSKKALAAGCWILRVVPKFADDLRYVSRYGVYYEGTLRVQWRADRGKQLVVASGDIYLFQGTWEGSGAPLPPLKPRRTVPIYERERYRYYLSLTDVRFSDATPALVLTFEVHRLDRSSASWMAEGLLTAELEQKAAPRGWRSKDRYFEGTVKNARQTPVAGVEMGWTSEYLRRAVVRMNKTTAVKAFPDAAVVERRKVTFESIFEKVGWQIKVEKSPEVVAEPAAGFWTDNELHCKMVELCGKSRQDKKWSYHLLCVSRIRKKLLFGFGKMYDSGAVDSNHVPREGAAIAARAKFPGPDDGDGTAVFGRAEGELFEDVEEAYLRAAIHETGHAMGLAHNFIGEYFMEGTKAIALRSEGKFPDNIEWAFHPEDAHRLAHLPDAWVRPGGLPFLHHYAFESIPLEDLTVTEQDRLELQVEPLNELLPLGAPLRLNLTLTNKKRVPLPVPENIGLGSGLVSGRVFGAGGFEHYFASVYRYADVVSPREDVLGPGESRKHSATLLRGRHGALLPSPGTYRVVVDVEWEVGGGGRAKVSATTHVQVQPPTDLAHAKAARRLIAEAEVTLPLVFRSEVSDFKRGPLRASTRKGVKAIDAALRADQLRPHYAVVEAKRQGSAGKLGEGASWVCHDTVMTPSEIHRLAELVLAELEDGASDDVRRIPTVRRLVAELQLRVDRERAAFSQTTIDLVQKVFAAIAGQGKG